MRHTLLITGILLLASPAARATDHALLIGCSHYDNLPANLQLHAADHDIQSLKGVLTSRFGFDTSRITTLSEGTAKVLGKDYRPTRASIEREFTALAGRVAPGDQVVILLSGHGSCCPEPGELPAGVARKPDGLRQQFLPCDCGTWNNNHQRVERSLIDFEVRSLIASVTRKQAFVWVIVDACYSGTMCRSTSATMSKEVPPSALGIPVAKFPAALGLPTETVNAVIDPEDRLVAFYATNRHRQTEEHLLEKRDGLEIWSGVFTQSICEELSQSAGPLSYADLLRNIRTRYESVGRSFLPEAEFGKTLRVLGRERLAVPPFQVIRRDGAEDRWVIDGGAIHGLTVGSYLDVLPQAGKPSADIPLGAVRVDRVRLTGLGEFIAEVVPAKWGDLPAAVGIAPACRCRPVYIEFGDSRPRVLAALSAKPALRAERARIAGRRADLGALTARLAAIAGQPDSVFTLAASPEEADWLVCDSGDGRLELLRGKDLTPEGKAADPDETASPLLFADGSLWIGTQPGSRASFPIPTPEKLGETLAAICRADLLVRLVAVSGSTRTTSDAQRVQAKVQFFKLEDGKRPREFNPDQQPPALGDRIMCRATCLSERGALTATVLGIDASYGITSLYPRPGRTNHKLLQGNFIESEPWIVGRDGRPGTERIVVLAAASSGEVLDFSFLTQPALTRERGPAVTSPLGRLFESQLYRSGGTRGVAVGATGGFLADCWSWNVRPKPEKP